MHARQDEGSTQLNDKDEKEKTRRVLKKKVKALFSRRAGEG